VSINEDCSLLAAGHSDGPVHVWSLTSDKLRSLKQPSELELIDKDADDVLEQMLDDKSGVDNRLLKGHLGAVYSLSFSPDKTLLLSSSADGTGTSNLRQSLFVA
jgi:transcription initiation factor TFIID subunit 5